MLNGGIYEGGRTDKVDRLTEKIDKLTEKIDDLRFNTYFIHGAWVALFLVFTSYVSDSKTNEPCRV